MRVLNASGLGVRIPEDRAVPLLMSNAGDVSGYVFYLGVLLKGVRAHVFAES